MVMNPNPINPNNSFEQQRISSPIGYEVTHELSENVILTTLDDLYKWDEALQLMASSVRHCLLLHRICRHDWLTF